MLNLHTKNSKGYSLFLALLPVLMMYKVPGINMGLSTILILVGMVYAVLVIINSKFKVDTYVVIPFIIYFIYVIFKSDVNNILLCVAIIIHLLAIACGAADKNKLRKYFILISCVAAVCVIIQFFVHLIINMHIPLININWCLEEMEQYRSNIITGISQYETLYRPSAFFLEPSHLAQYCSIGLVSSLLFGKPDYKKALLISAGVLLTTSGIGIVLVAVIWCVFPFVATKGIDSRKLKRTILIIAGGAIVIAVLLQMPFFQSSLSRLTGGSIYSSTQYNAIWGRTLYWSSYISPMCGQDLIFGYGEANLPDVYFTGIMTVLYSYGILGLILLYFSLLVLFIKSSNWNAKILTGIYMILLIVANLTGFISIIYYIGFTLCIGINDGIDDLNPSGQYEYEK